MPAPTLHDLAVMAKEIYVTMETNRTLNTVNSALSSASSALNTLSLGLTPSYSSSKAHKFDGLIKAGNDVTQFGEALQALQTEAHADKNSKSLPNIVDILNHCYQAAQGGYATTIDANKTGMLTPSTAAEQAIDELTPIYNEQFTHVPNRAEFLYGVSRFLTVQLRMEHLRNLQAAAEQTGAEEERLKQARADAEALLQQRNDELVLDKEILEATNEALVTAHTNATDIIASLEFNLSQVKATAENRAEMSEKENQKLTRQVEKLDHALTQACEELELQSEILEKNDHQLKLQGKLLEDSTAEKNSLKSHIHSLEHKLARLKEKFQFRLQTVEEERDQLKADVQFFMKSSEDNNEISTNAIDELQKQIHLNETMQEASGDQVKIIGHLSLEAKEQADRITGLSIDLDYVSDQLKDSQAELKETQNDLLSTQHHQAHTAGQLQNVCASHAFLARLLHHTQTQLYYALYQLEHVSAHQRHTAEQNFHVVCQNMGISIELIKTQVDLQQARRGLQDARLENEALWRYLARTRPTHSQGTPVFSPQLFHQRAYLQHAQQQQRLQQPQDPAVVLFNKKTQ